MCAGLAVMVTIDYDDPVVCKQLATRTSTRQRNNPLVVSTSRQPCIVCFMPHHSLCAIYSRHQLPKFADSILRPAALPWKCKENVE